MSNNGKKLTLGEIRKQDKKLNEQYDAQIWIDGEEFVLKIDQSFRDTKINRMLADVLKFIDDTKSAGKEPAEMFSVYTMLLIVKHFTSLSVPDDYESQLELLNQLIDLDILDQIMSKLPEDELDRVYSKADIMIKNVNSNIDRTVEEFDKLELQNDEVLKVMGVDTELGK